MTTSNDALGAKIRGRNTVSFKGQCSRCGWTTKRKLEKIGRPCPKCVGSIQVHQDDREAAWGYIILFVIIGGAFAILMTALGAGKP
jgi:hypothetical protein